MIKPKDYTCDICGRSVRLRSTIKEGQYKGKKCCPFCKGKFEAKKKKVKKKVREEGKMEFFQIMIERLKKNPVCQNCGCRINPYVHPANNIAHILSKRTFKSVAFEPQNIVFLCDSKDHPLNNPKSCHGEFDSFLSKKKEMPIFGLVCERVSKLNVLEKGKELDVFEL